MNDQALREACQQSMSVADRQRNFINRVFGWMFIGLGISAMVAYYTATSGILFSNPNLMLLFIIGTIGMALAIGFGINKMSASAATVCFVIYAVLNGGMLSSVLLIYAQSSVIQAFCTTALMFGATGLFGYVTKRDLTSLGGFLMMALIGLIVASVLNMFFASSSLDWLISIAGVVIFVGLTAYDVQKIKQLAIAHGEGELEDEIAKKASILGALTLYLDFINLFLYLLRFFGRGNDR